MIHIKRTLTDQEQKENATTEEYEAADLNNDGHTTRDNAWPDHFDLIDHSSNGIFAAQKQKKLAGQKKSWGQERLAKIFRQANHGPDCAASAHNACKQALDTCER